ncbi:hypothetical protein EV368DRAFT_83294 [Lentinula lateritia]|nr:hypothetical protein EV368DRAFT_83294 [Lentinula lateritia]
MPSSSPRATFSALSPPIRSRLSSRESAAPASEGEVEQDELAFTIESPSQPQLQLFENIFNTGKSLASYCHDDPLWSTLAKVALPCSNCVRHLEACKVPAGSPRCSSCTGKKTCSLGKLLRHRYFARRCSQDLAYSRKFLELHGSPAQRVSWGIPEDAWRRYDNRLHSQVSSTSILLELNMLHDQDTRAVDRRELERFHRAREQEAALAAKRKLAHASPPRDGSTKKRWLAKTSSHPGTSEIAAGEVPRVVRLVIPPARPAPPPSSPSPLLPSSVHSVLAPGIVPVSRQTGSVGDPEPLVYLAEVAGHQTGFGTGSVDRFAVPVPPVIKAPQEDTNVSTFSMPPANRPALVPRILAQHPYRAENERLVAQVRLLQSQLASSRQENSTLASAHRDTSTLLEARQGELKQLRASTSLSSQWQEESLVDESNVLAVRQRKRIEALQEEVHRFWERALFVEKMVREYPEEGSYSVSLPPLAEVQGKLNDTLAALRRVATFAHRLYHSNPATVLHQHNRYMGTIIEAIISFLRRGLDTAEPNVIVRSFQLALEFMEAA